MTRRYSITAVALAVWIGMSATSAATLPVPDGGYAVGVVRAEFTDPSRLLDASDPSSGPRRLPAVVWYPAHGHAEAEGAAYLQPEVAATTLPAITRNFRYAEGELDSIANARIAVRPGAEPARHPRRFPVVVYSHGLFLYPEQNSALASRLASHGYIVVSIAHPGDSTDVRLQDSRVIATRFGGPADDPRFAESWKVIAGGADLSVRREALAVYADAIPATRLGRSLVQWRDDTLFVAQSIVYGREPDALHPILANADRKRLAFAGMSFGGATSATSCQRVEACRAAINLDGQNFDPDLFDRPVGRPLLLMLSDWPRYGLLEGQPREPDFSPNDLAYERWNEAGENDDVVRVRLHGIRHLGFTDLVALLNGPKRDERVGEIDGDAALSTIGDVVLAFLDTYVREGDAAGIDRALERHSALERHVPARLKKWAGKADRSR